MSLSAGSRLGPYEVLAPLGAGGMGEVFRARDTQLHREVALKVLPAELAADPARVARFRREAQLLAALNHPGIAAIYGLAEEDGVLALVLELVEGEDLSQRMKRGPLPLDEAVPIARDIAEALEEAHERGIVHRDLKPSNVKVTPDGKVKVLDFGLAKAFSDEPSDPANPQLSRSLTMTHRATQAGMVIGTAPYMSPEQARGKPVDKRSDVWAFGAVLYELITGRRLFEGETVSDVLAAILRGEIDWSALPAQTPPRVRSLLERCLERDVKRRLRDIGEARLALEGGATATGPVTLAGSGLVAVPAAAKPRPSLRATGGEFALGHPFATVMIVGILAVMVMSITRGGRGGGEDRPARRQPGLRLKVEVSADKPLPDQLGSAAVLSPDGRTLGFVRGEGQKTSLWLRRLDQLEAVMVPESLGARSPFFSPDGQWVAFFGQGRLLKAPVTGGAPSVICGVTDARGGSWGKGGAIVLAPEVQSGLVRVSADGGTPETLTSPDAKAGERSHRWPHVLPDGEHALFAVQAFGQDYDEGTIEAVSLKSKKRTVVHRGGSFPRYARSGHLLFARRGVLYAARFDADDLELTGPPRPALQSLMASTGNEAVGDGSAQYDVSASGDLLYRTGEPPPRDAQLAVVDAKGAAQFRDDKKHVFFGRPRFSPDGRRLAADIDAQPGVHVWVYDLARGSHARVTFEQNNVVPEWTPDGRFLTFVSAKLAVVGGPMGPSGDAIYFVEADSSGAPEPLFRAEGRPLYDRSFSPDGRSLAIDIHNEKTGSDIALLRLDGPLRRGVKVSGPEPLVATEAEEAFPAISPDGRFLAYAESTNRGGWRVFVRPFPSGDGRREAGAGVFPRWSGDGRTLYYQNDGRLFAMAVELRGGLPTFGEERAVFERGVSDRAQGFYDIAPDGRRFAMIESVTPRDAALADARHVVLAFDWTDELKRLFEAR